MGCNLKKHPHLAHLEAESIFILREVVAECANPVLLYSVGKDSSVLLRLVQKAFYPGKIPLPLLHIDTGFKFKEMYTFRDQFLSEIGATLLVHSNQEPLQSINPFQLGTKKCCQKLKTEALLEALKKGSFDAAIGGSRRDEEKSRAKERVFSLRDAFGQWDPKNQRPELWNLYNTAHKKEESLRVFPLSNWTELDIWHYIHQESIPIVPLYFAKEREVIVRGNMLIPCEAFSNLQKGELPTKMMCRFRTLGCSPCTGAIRSLADTIEKIIEELQAVSTSERVARLIDHEEESAMELKKRAGYF